VQTSAPDMENSNVIANPDPQVIEKMVAPVEKAVKKSVAKKVPAKKAVATKKPATKKADEKEGFVRVELGGDMPYYLL
jgi:hypothetical protein